MKKGKKTVWAKWKCQEVENLHGKGSGTPLQYSYLGNPMGLAKSRTWLSDFTFTFHFHALEKEMATHSSVLAWRIPGTGEPDGLPSMGSHRVRHDWSDLVVVVVGIEMLQFIRNITTVLLYVCVHVICRVYNYCLIMPFLSHIFTCVVLASQ